MKKTREQKRALKLFKSDKPKQIFETGIDALTGKPILAEHNGGRWISPTKYQTSDGKIHTNDVNEISYEVYNQNDFVLIFENVHPDEQERKAWQYIKVEPKEHKLIPHRYVVPWIEQVGNTQDKREIKVLESTGTAIGKKNTLPSKLTSN